MDEVKPTPEQIQRWAEQADWDLGTARHNMDGERHDAAVLFCQQAAEKMLKAAYTPHGREATRTHDLADLLEDLDAPRDLKALSSRLTADYIMTRYPDATAVIPAKAYSRTQAEDRLRRAEQIIDWARRVMEEASDASDR